LEQPQHELWWVDARAETFREQVEGLLVKELLRCGKIDVLVNEED